MAMGVHRRAGRAAPMSEINVTPLVDVMLVLLIIFMITAPLLVAGVPVDLPAAKAKAITPQDEPVALSIDAAGLVYIGEEAVGEDELGARLAAIAATRADTRVLVRADRALAYGRVLEVMGEVSGAGLTKVALVSQPPEVRR